MNTNQTPGPWKIVGDGRVDITIIAPNFGVVAHLPWKGHIFIQEANARLIAAAPDVLSVLEEILLWDDSNHKLPGHLGDRARAAIAKAKD